MILNNNGSMKCQHCIINMIGPGYPELLDKLFVIEDKNLRVQISVLKQICSCEDYKRLIDITLIFQRLFQTSKQHLTIRELIGDSVYPFLNNNGENKIEKRIDFFIDSLNNENLLSIISQLQTVRRKLKYSIYSIKLMNIIQMLKHSSQQSQKSQEKKDSIGLLGDFEVFQEQYKKVIVSHQQEGIPNSKLNQICKKGRLFLQGKFSNTSTLINFIATEIVPQFQKCILSIPLLNHTDRQSQIMKVLGFIYKYCITQYQIEIQISKNTLVETRIYLNKQQKELLYLNRKSLLNSLKKIINEAILCPYSLNIQIILLRILRRLYYLIDNRSISSSQNLQNTHQLSPQELTSNIIRNPLYLTLRNIALFSEGKEEEYKEASMLMYKIIQDKNDIELITLLEGCEELRFLKNSKYFSSKAYAYANEIEKIYQPMQLGSLYLKNYQLITSRTIWVYTFIVEKPSTLLSWQFYLTGYDIKFGIYKTQHLRELTHEQYQKGTDCRQLVKLDKIQNNQSHPNKGHLYVKNGVYRFVFDNSFSIMRNKQLVYTFLQLDCVV